MSDISYAKEDRVATITLNRPHARNALTSAMIKTLQGCLRAADQDENVDAIVLTGADPAFCAGLDLNELGRWEPRILVVGSAGEVSRRISWSIAPDQQIARRGGQRVGRHGRLRAALHCDFLIASDRARFADTHARVGIQPDWGLTVLLPQAIGVRRAREMSATGNFVDAATALEWGLVNRVVRHPEFRESVRSLMADVVSNDQVAVRRIMTTYADGLEHSSAFAWNVEAEAARSARRDGFDSAEVEKRRENVLGRGRTQSEPASARDVP